LIRGLFLYKKLGFDKMWVQRKFSRRSLRTNDATILRKSLHIAALIA
jgi:hypothetical protein